MPIDVESVQKDFPILKKHFMTEGDADIPETERCFSPDANFIDSDTEKKASEEK